MLCSLDTSYTCYNLKLEIKTSIWCADAANYKGERLIYPPRFPVLFCHLRVNSNTRRFTVHKYVQQTYFYVAFEKESTSLPYQTSGLGRNKCSERKLSFAKRLLISYLYYIGQETTTTTVSQWQLLCHCFGKLFMI